MVWEIVSKNLGITEAGVRRCSLKKVLLKILQNSQGNTCASVSFLIKLQAKALLKKRLWHRCFPVNFAKSLRIRFFLTLLVAVFGIILS